MRNLLLSIAFATTLTAAAHAIPMPTSYTYDFSAAARGSNGSGTITTDASGKVTAAAITFTASEKGFNGGIFNNIDSQKPLSFGFGGKAGYSVNLTDAGSDTLFLDLDATLAGTASAGVCAGGDNCSGMFGQGPSSTISYGSTGILYLTSGTLSLEESPLTPPVTTAATPEPSSLILLGTGALGLAGAVRRRFFPRT